jgi:predicted O-methyltransferase YrrM
MAASVPLLRRRGRGHHSSRALARALRLTALGRASEDEQAWLSRIDAWRDRLGSETGLAGVLAQSPEANDGARPSAGDLAGAMPWCSVPRLWGRFLMRLVIELKPDSCLELGTGFGVSGAYQAAALELNDGGTLTTIDAGAQGSIIAERGFAKLGLGDRVRLERGLIADKLADMLKGTAPINYAFLDADHTEEATLAHFDAVVPYLSANAIMVLDDISWTQEMRRAWRTIVSREEASVAVDLGRMGVVVKSGG